MVMEYKKENIALGIFIFSILIVVGLILFAVNQNLTGKVIQYNEENIPVVSQNPENKISCTDSDGNNYGVKGVVNYCDANGCSSKEDSCSGKKLTEWYCENNERKSGEYNCENDCDDGVCLSVANKYTYPYSSGGSGGGISSGGSSGSPVVPSSGQTYDLGELSSENTLDIVKYDNINFKITGNEYSLTLQDKTNSQVTIKIGSNTFNLDIGKEKKIDLNNDGNSEIYIKLRSINTINGKVTLTLNLDS